MKSAVFSNDLALLDRLLSRNSLVISDFLELIKIVGDDTEAIRSIVQTLAMNQSGAISNNNLRGIFSEMLDFMSRDRYRGRISGEFASRFRRTHQAQSIQARAEITLAEDLLDGTTPLGTVQKIIGIAPPRDLNGVEIQGIEIPEYRVVDSNSVSRLVEIKTPSTVLSKTNFKSNLNKAISQVKGESGSYVRIDASHLPSPQITTDEFYRFVNGQLRDPIQGGINFVEFVEIIYQNSSGQIQRLIYQVQQSNVVDIT